MRELEEFLVENSVTLIGKSIKRRRTFADSKRIIDLHCFRMRLHQISRCLNHVSNICLLSYQSYIPRAHAVVHARDNFQREARGAFSIVRDTPCAQPTLRAREKRVTPLPGIAVSMTPISWRCNSPPDDAALYTRVCKHFNSIAAGCLARSRTCYTRVWHCVVAINVPCKLYPGWNFI